MFARTFLALVALAAVASADHHSWTGVMEGKFYTGSSTCDGTPFEFNITTLKEVTGEAGCICQNTKGVSQGFPFESFSKYCIAACTSTQSTYNVTSGCTDNMCGTCTGATIVQTQGASQSAKTADLYKCAASNSGDTKNSYIYTESMAVNADAFLKIYADALEESGIAGCEAASTTSSAAGASAAFLAVLAALAFMF